MRIKTVRSNVKVGCDVEVGEKTIIVGPNGSGKSTIINAIELALTGRASDIAGRVDVAREADIMSLAKDGSGELEALVGFDDGVVAAYRTSGSTAKAKKASGDKPSDRCHDEVLPIRTLREAVLGSPQTARKYLLAKVGGATTRADVRNLLPVPVQPLWDNLAATHPATTPVADVLVAVLEAAAQRARDAASEAKTNRSTAKAVGDGFAAPPSEADLDAARAAVKAARTAFAAADQHSLLATRLAQAQERAERAALDAQAKADAFGKAKVEHAAVPAPVGNTESLLAIADVMTQSVAAGECLPCGGSTKPVGDRLREVQAVLKKSAEDTARHRAVTVALDRARSEAERALAALESAEEDVATLLAEQQTPAPVGRDAAEAALDAAQKALATLNSTRENWAIVQRAESSAIDAERRAAEWKTLKEACEGAVGTVLDKALATFIARVQSNLPASDKFDMKLRDGEREVVAFGLVSADGKLRTALSGAEWARVMAAMAEACVDAGKYACIVPEERAFDPKTLSDVLKALSSCSHQVIIASPVAPKPLPKGWTLIKRGVEE